MGWGGGTGTYLRIPFTTGAPGIRPATRKVIAPDAADAEADPSPRGRRMARAVVTHKQRVQVERPKKDPPPPKPKPAPPAIPLPEGFWQSRTGKIYQKNREYTVCPRCKNNWKVKESIVCGPCANEDGTKQRAAAKRLATMAAKKEEKVHE